MKRRIAPLLGVTIVLIVACTSLGLYAMASTRALLPPPVFHASDLSPEAPEARAPWEGNWASFLGPHEMLGTSPLDVAARRTLREDANARGVAAHAESFASALTTPMVLHEGTALPYLVWTRNVLIAALVRYDAGDEAFAFALFESLLGRELELAQHTCDLLFVIVSIEETLEVLVEIGQAPGGLSPPLHSLANTLATQRFDLGRPSIAMYLEQRARLEALVAETTTCDRITFDPEETGRLLNEHATQCVAYARDETHVVAPTPPPSWQSRLFNRDGQILSEVFASEATSSTAMCGGVNQLRLRDAAMHHLAERVAALPIRP